MRDPFSGPRVVSFIFKGFAILSGLGGAVVLVVLKHHEATVSLAQIASVVGATLFSAATLLFFAYVLELLADIKDNSERIK